MRDAVRNKKKREISILLSCLILLMMVNLVFNTNILIPFQKDNIKESKDDNTLRSSTTDVSGKPLLINQYSTITNSFFPTSLPTNASFSLYNGWISQNVTINYEGVSQKRQRVFNGKFDTNATGWSYKSNNPTEYINQGWQSSTGNPPGCVQINLDTGSKNEGDYGYYEQNITISEKLSSGLQSRLSIESFLSALVTLPSNISVYLAVIIGNVEKNMTYDLQTYLDKGVWATLTMTYDPSVFGQIAPDIATIRVGINTDGSAYIQNPQTLIQFDNIKFELWTMPNEKYLVTTFDNEFGSDYSYTNSSYGKGHTFIDIERTRNPTSEVIFTISSNKSGILDLIVYNVTIHSSVVRPFNTTISGVDGSRMTLGDSITWETDINFSESYKYGEIWAEVVKPTDWNIIHIYDRDNIDRVASCIGIGLGTNKAIIPVGIMTPSNIEKPWQLIANSKNYISNANMTYWNGTIFKEESKITIGDKFQINVALNESIPFLNTELNCTIKYPNETIYWKESRTPSSYSIKFGNFTAGSNMTAGKYQVIIEWINNQSDLLSDKAGFKLFDFIIWHHTNLTAINPDIEILAGDPLLIKVKFIDYDFNSTIEFAVVNYSSTFGQYGTMVYLGSGIYFAEIVSNSLEVGDYYISCSAYKSYYENRTITNLIHLKIVPQQLALALSHPVIETSANEIVSCHVNVTGANAKVLLWPVNISTDWFNSYNVTDHDNGTYTLDFSTVDIPTQGYLESYTIKIYANKTGYGNANSFLTLLVHPVPTIANVNVSLVSVYQNDIINVRANYTDEVTHELINGANCSISWQGTYVINPIADEFDIILNTMGLTVDYYDVLLTFHRAGYEIAFKSFIVIINEQEVNLSVSINSVEINENSLKEASFQQQLNISARVRTIMDGTYLSGGNITLLSNNYQKDLTEMPSTYFNTSLILDGAYFNTGINTIILRFEQTNYSTRLFAFQLYISAQAIDLIVQVNSQGIPENHLYAISYNLILNLSCRAYAEVEKIFLSGGRIALVNGELEMNLTEQGDNWFNLSMQVNSSFFSVGPNYAYLRFQQANYTTTIFPIQIFVNQIEFHVVPIGLFENVIRGKQGEQVIIKINLTELNTASPILNATIYYDWRFGHDFFEEEGNGVYNLTLILPTDFSGTYNMQLYISKEGVTYKAKEYSLSVEIQPIELPNFVFWIITIGLVAISTTLGILSLRTYVLIPRKRKKEAELLNKIQVYKDIRNIQALMLIQRSSGIPLYTQEIRIFESDDDSFMVSGFIQAITNFSDTLIKREFSKYKDIKAQSTYSKYIIELDFNIFQLLVCDYGDLRILIFLKEKSSERIKKQLYLLNVALNSQYQEKFASFSGNIGSIKPEIIYMVNQFLFIHYIEKFKINEDRKYVETIINSGELTKMEKRLFNVILSISKTNKEFYLQEPIELIHEKNEDVVFIALDTLIKQKLIISTYIVQYNSKLQ